MIARLSILAGLAAVLGAGCSAQPGSHAHDGGAAAAAGAPVLFDNLGDYQRRISTASREAQAYFDQGLRLVYGFNHYEGSTPSRKRRGAIPRAPFAIGASRWRWARTTTARPTPREAGLQAIRRRGRSPPVPAPPGAP
jgi:hypothetical protein